MGLPSAPDQADRFERGDDLLTLISLKEKTSYSNFLFRNFISTGLNFGINRQLQ